MTEISISDIRVCIIKATDFDSVNEGLESMKNALVDFTAKHREEKSGLDIVVFIDLSRFNIIHSSLIGALGSIILHPNIHLLGLCGLQPAVTDILKQFGLLPEKASMHSANETSSEEYLHKVRVFASIAEGLVCLDQA